MFDHISIGVRDVAKAMTFYDAALKPLGLTCLSADDTSLGYGKEAAGSHAKRDRPWLTPA
jgi:catechol 2,3-dioxygenase-like lactoylglutathione lyase family enzyme